MFGDGSFKSLNGKNMYSIFDLLTLSPYGLQGFVFTSCSSASILLAGITVSANKTLSRSSANTFRCEKVNDNIEE